MTRYIEVGMCMYLPHPGPTYRKKKKKKRGGKEYEHQCASASVELGVDAAVADAVDLELEAEAGAVDDHLEREVEVVELDAARRGQAREEVARHGAQVRRQRAHVHQVARVGRRRLVRLARDQVVRHHQRLARAEVARVVERDGLQRRDGFALFLLLGCVGCEC